MDRKKFNIYSFLVLERAEKITQIKVLQGIQRNAVNQTEKSIY